MQMIERAEERGMTYDIFLDDAPPIPGDYLVSIGKKGIGTVYLIRSIRPVQKRAERDWDRYSLRVISMPELKPYTEFERTEDSANVWVRGEPAHPMFWWPRNEKSLSSSGTE